MKEGQVLQTGGTQAMTLKAVAIVMDSNHTIEIKMVVLGHEGTGEHKA